MILILQAMTMKLIGSNLNIASTVIARTFGTRSFLFSPINI